MNKPYECKFLWASRDLDDELRKIAKQISINRGLQVSMQLLSHQLAIDLKEGRIKIQPDIIRFKNVNMIKIDDKKMKLRKYHVQI